MPAERLPMRKIREVLRLKYACGASKRVIAQTVGIGPTSVGEYVRRAAVGVGFLGVLIIIRPDAGLDPIGTLFGLLTAFMFAGQYIATRRVAADDPFTTLVWSGAVGSVCRSEEHTSELQ